MKSGENRVVRLEIEENISPMRSVARDPVLGRILVEGGYAGQVADLRILKQRRGKTRAVIEKIVSSPPCVVDAPCAMFGKCGGCGMLDLEYGSQLSIKTAYVTELLSRAGIIMPDGEPEVIGAVSQLRYRNKMEYSFGDEYPSGPVNLGMHERARHHDTVETPDCLICPEDFSVIRQAVQDWARDEALPFYSTATRQGVLRHLTVRHSVHSGECMVNLTAAARVDTASLAERLLSSPAGGRISGLLFTLDTGLSQAINPSGGYSVVFGEPFLTERVCGLDFRIGPFSFFQTNTLMAERLYGKVKEYCGDLEGASVTDLFCGTGTIGQILASGAKEVCGIEMHEPSVIDARANAAANGIENITFICADARKAVPGAPAPGVAVVDPPRAGLLGLSGILAGTGAPRIVYVSCNPVSLAQDLGVLCRAGYSLERLCVCDLFPNTQHVEMITLLQRSEGALRGDLL